MSTKILKRTINKTQTKILFHHNHRYEYDRKSNPMKPSMKKFGTYKVKVKVNIKKSNFYKKWDDFYGFILDSSQEILFMFKNHSNLDCYYH